MVLVSAFERRKEGRLNRFDFSFEISFEINRDTVNVGVKDNRCFVNNRAIRLDLETDSNRSILENRSRCVW